jgi:hypothetical protein
MFGDWQRELASLLDKSAEELVMGIESLKSFVRDDVAQDQAVAFVIGCAGERLALLGKANPTETAATAVEAAEAAANCGPPSKKCKQAGGAGEGAAQGEAAPSVVCEHCFAVVPKVTFRVACLDGTTRTMTVPKGELVNKVKRELGRACNVRPKLIELFLAETEDGLADDQRLHNLGINDGTVLFMLCKLGWAWSAGTSRVTIDTDGLVANVDVASYTGEPDPPENPHRQLLIGGDSMTEGRHWKEVIVYHGGRDACDGQHGSFSFDIGVTRPCEIAEDFKHPGSLGDCFIDDCFTTSSCTVEGTTRTFHEKGHDESWWCAGGDRIGVLLDLDEGWVRFYRNGVRCGPGIPSGVTGPLVFTVAFYGEGGPGDCVATVAVQEGAAAPVGAGDADEPWTRHGHGPVSYRGPVGSGRWVVPPPLQAGDPGLTGDAERAWVEGKVSVEVDDY